MAFLISRSVLALSKRSLSMGSVRAKDWMMPDPREHATGLERKELDAIARGNDNPFDMRVYKRGPGTKTQPNEVPSFYEQRLIGCICHEDAFFINYMWIHKGDPRRCECGHWFKLVPAKDPFKE